MKSQVLQSAHAVSEQARSVEFDDRLNRQTIDGPNRSSNADRMGERLLGRRKMFIDAAHKIVDPMLQQGEVTDNLVRDPGVEVGFELIPLRFACVSTRVDWTCQGS